MFVIFVIGIIGINYVTYAAPAASGFVEKFTNYSPIQKGINGHCGTSASGKDACAYFLEDYLAGKTTAVMGAVPQKGGTGNLFGGMYKAPALQTGLGANKPIIIFAGDRYATSSNNLSKMDIVTREPRSAPAIKVNTLKGELVPIGRADGLPTPQRQVTRDPNAVTPVVGNQGTQTTTQPTTQTTIAPAESNNYVAVPQQTGSTPISSNPTASKTQTSVIRNTSTTPTTIQTKLVCPDPSTFAKDIYNCGKNEIAAQVGDACSKILIASLKKQSDALTDQMNKVTQNISAAQNSTFIGMKEQLALSTTALTNQITTLQQNTSMVSSYTNAMIDFADGKDDKTSAECFTKNYYSLQNVVSGLDQEIIRAKAAREQAIALTNTLNASATEMGSATNSTTNNPSNMQTNQGTARAVKQNSSSISPSSLPKK